MPKHENPRLEARKRTENQYMKDAKTNLIELHDLYKTYHVGEIDVPVLKGVSLNIARGELVALMGELAVAPEDTERYAKDKYPKLTPEMLQHLDDLVAKIEKEKITFDGWATPGASVASAALDVARTVCRRQFAKNARTC